MQYDTIRAIQWQDDKLLLLDQRKLPNEVVYLEYGSAGQVAEGLSVKERVYAVKAQVHAGGRRQGRPPSRTQ